MKFAATALAAVLLSAPPALAAPLRDLQQAVEDAEKLAGQRDQEHKRQHREVLQALRRGSPEGVATAEAREQTAVIGALQSTTALRRARQRLAEAVNDAVEQGEAIERAAARAGHGEVAPSASDLLACAGPDCAQVAPREHGALVMMGAIAPSFDKTNWPPADAPDLITVIAPFSEPTIAGLRAGAEQAAGRAHDAAVAAEQARAALKSGAGSAQSYAEAQTAADEARAEQGRAEARLQERLRYFADAGRAVKRAALLAGDGYMLSDKDEACRRDVCVSAGGHLEAAAFVVIGAVDRINAGLRNAIKPYVIQTNDGGFIFH